MKTRVLGIAVVILMGVIFGLMFNATQETMVLTRQMVSQQGKMIDLLRSIIQEGKTSDTALADLSKKVGDIHAVVKRMPAPQEKARRPREDFNKVYEIPTGASVVKGKENAPITIVGFFDLECPFSKRFQPVIDQVLEAYPAKVKYIVKHFPLGFHKQAIPAAKAVLAAGEQGKYYEMMAAVLENNRELSAEKYEELAKGAGLNVKKFRKALKVNDEAWTKLIQEDFALGQKVAVRGTPTFYLNGKKTQARSLDAFKTEIDKILAENK